MPSPSWNHVWSARDVGGFTHSQLILSYLKALRERYAAAFGIDGYTYTTVTRGDQVLRAGTTGIPGGRGWGQVQRDVVFYSQVFTRKHDAGGAAYSPQGSGTIESATQAIIGGVPTPIAFPWPNGFTRKFPREIYKLACPGTAGQRARFSFRNGTPWYGDVTTATGFGLNVTTPSGEASNTGKLFDFVSGAWTLSTDQATDPDTVTDHLNTGVTGVGLYYYPGDYFGPHVLNDLRDALNQMTILGFTNNAGSPAILSNTGGFVRLDTGLSRSSGVWFTEAQARTAYDAAGNVAATFVTPGAGYSSDAGFSGQYSLGASLGYARVLKFAGTTFGWANPLGQAFHASYWLRANPTGSVEFDDYGSGVIQSKWTECAPRNLISDLGASGTTPMGTIPASTAAFAAPSAPHSSRGWSAQYYAVLADYECDGGFAYSAST